MALHQYLSIYESAIMLVLLDVCISDLWGFYLTLTDILTEQKQQLCEDCCTLQYTSLFIRFNPCLVCVYYIWTWLRAVEEHNCISGRQHHSLRIFFSQLLKKMKDLSKKKKNSSVSSVFTVKPLKTNTERWCSSLSHPSTFSLTPTDDPNLSKPKPTIKQAEHVTNMGWITSVWYRYHRSMGEQKSLRQVLLPSFLISEVSRVEASQVFELQDFFFIYFPRSEWAGEPSKCGRQLEVE